jgi:ABC-type transporter Mla subunit MlaD
MNDRILGYLLISLILAFLSVPTSLIIWKTAHPLPTRTIEFEPVKSVNFLNIQDPVMVHGREIGQVRSIENKNRKLFLKIETRNDLIIFRNYKIAILSKGVMGDRYLDINPVE